MIVSQGVRLAAIAALPGIVLAYAAARGMSALLFGVKPTDPVTTLAAIALVLCMTLAGSLLPALRAVQVSPMVALRAE
jgi:ABC-type antimicrobial peptide transport system permease subunit